MATIRSVLLRAPARRRLDRLGVLLSAACLAHCLAGAFLVSLLGLGSLAIADPWVHRFGLVLAIIFAAGSLGFAMRHHRALAPRVVAVAGIASMAGALLADHGTGETALTLVGVTLVAAAHLVNLRRRD